MRINLTVVAHFMAAQKIYRLLIVYLYACMFAVFLSGCSGGSGDQAGTSTSVAGSYIDIAAIPGPIVAAKVGQVVVLDDSKSYAKSREPLSYNWSFSYKPAGSNAKLQDATSATPSFVADVRGVYMVQLVVSAEGVSSQRAITSVVVTNPGERPTGPFYHEGLSSNCVNCHNDDFITIPSKGPVHIGASNVCQSCHTPQGFNIIPAVDHQEVFGNCSQCHNNEVAIGKSQFHSPTNAECNDCHNTIAFLERNPDGSFDHSNIGRACSGCHNGTVATGKTPATDDIPAGTHPVTNSECGYCHTTASFLGAYPDHTGDAVVGNRCDSCHGVSPNDQPSDPPVGHPVTNVDCDTCHSIVSFKMPGGLFNHSLVDPSVQSCESCHNDSTSINAPAKSSAVPAHPVTTSDCGACHNTDTFTGAFQDHTNIANNCQSCHGVSASGKSLNHMPTNPNNPGTVNDQDCVDCHSTGTFSTGTYDHAGVNSGCTSCHNDVISVGKLLNHIPTNPANQDCVDCHDTLTFAGVIFDHVGINTSNCALCHDGDIALGKSLNHVPTSSDCSSCHVTNDFTTFAGITFNHFGINNNDCASCHDTGIATGKTGVTGDYLHIPAQGECSVCHDSTAVFTSTTFSTSVHAGITRGCEGCHSGQFSTISGSLYGKPGNHIPTAQDCDVCHTVARFKPSDFDHTGITGNCVSCHNGNFVNVGVKGASAAPNTPIHQNTSGDCSVCHNTTDFADAFVDHNGPEVVGKRCDSCHNGIDATGKNAKTNPPHVSTTQDCNICHVAGGTFAPAVFNHDGIVNNCASCHDGVAATGMSQNHLPTNGQDCSVCHITSDFANARFNHAGIVDNCASCHNGTTASGKTPPPNHVPTNEDCHVCHVTTGFIPATFDHSGIVGNCSSCHNNVFAIGKSGSHVLTNQDCGVCHNTTTFIGAVFDHTGIVDNCSSCHGVTATGMSNDHISTALDCHFCHTTATFVGGTWFHDASTRNNCDSCHSPGNGAASKPNGHLNTTEQCDVCHTTDRWAPTDFRHTSKNYPGDHRRNPGCTGCHKGSIGGGINRDNYPDQERYAPFCAGCHAGDFESEGDHIGGRSGTIEQNKNCGQSGCHRVSSSGF